MLNRVELNRRFLSSFEQGISVKLKEGVSNGNFFGDATESSFHVCLDNNDMNNLNQDAYSSITFVNLKTINLVLFTIYALIIAIIFLEFLVSKISISKFICLCFDLFYRP